MNKRQRKKAFKTVLKSLSGIPLFRGMYDAEHGSKEYIWGVEVVMDVIAYHAECFKYQDMFAENMLESERKCEHEDN